MPGPVLSVEELTLRAVGKRVLADASFNLPSVGMTALMGPVGAGKSTLLKWLGARADPEIYSAEYTRAVYFHAPLSRRNHPPLYAQRQAQSLKQMMMLFSVHLSANPPLICIDEATADLPANESARIMERLAIMAQSRAIIVVTHNQIEAQQFSDNIMLLAGGRLEEFTPTRQFFSDPQSDAGRQFVGSGWVTTAGVDTPNHHLSHDLRRLPFEVGVKTIGAAGRLRSIIPGQIYVLECPDDNSSLAEDVEAIKLVGIDRFAASPQTSKATTETFKKAGILSVEGSHEYADESLLANLGRCKSVQQQLKAGHSVVFPSVGKDAKVSHAVARQLIFSGVTADKAARIAAELRGMDALDVLEEQDLWDFELASDLECDDVDPSFAKLEQPEIRWIDAQVPRSRSAMDNTATPPGEACGLAKRDSRNRSTSSVEATGGRQVSVSAMPSSNALKKQI